jgi:hypothetical protein
MPDVRINQLSDDDSRSELIELLDISRQIMDAASIPISDGSRMASDQAATEGTPIDLAMMCVHYLGGSEDFLASLQQLMQPQPNTLQIP